MGRIKWYEDLYVGEQVRGKEKKRIRQIAKCGRPRHYYLIAYPSNEENLLDIMPVWTARHYDSLQVIGLAKNKREALHVAGVILDEVYRRTGGFAVQAYLDKPFTGKTSGSGSADVFP